MGKKIWGRRMKNVECRGKKNEDNVGISCNKISWKISPPVILRFIIVIVIKKIVIVMK